MTYKDNLRADRNLLEYGTHDAEIKILLKLPHPGILAKYFKDSWNILDRMTDEEYKDNEKRYLSQALLSLPHLHPCASSQVWLLQIQLFSLA